MKLLLDTHILLWHLADNPKLSIETLLPEEIIILPLKVEHIGYLKYLPFHHRDPFDRIIITQAIVEEFTLLTDDEAFKKYDVSIWGG